MLLLQIALSIENRLTFENFFRYNFCNKKFSFLSTGDWLCLTVLRKFSREGGVELSSAGFVDYKNPLKEHIFQGV